MLNSPSVCKTGHPCEPVSLKEALHCAVSHGPQGSLIDPIAARLDIRPGTLRDALNPNEPDWLPSRHLDAVAIFTAGHPVIARHVASLQGGFFYAVRGGPIDQATATSVREFAEFLQELVRNGPTTPEKLLRIRKEGTDAMAAIQSAITDAELRGLTWPR